MSRFNPELAEELSLVAHALCKDPRHDIGIELAKVVYKWLANELDSEEINVKDDTQG